ncbi:MAG: hypothetical protein EOM80_07755 [Erysipelotrichia bacterium]|nr:hypothetical protein [Erysipelotrichia bacterium]
MTISKRLKAVSTAYQLLSNANSSFIEKNSGIDGFRNLIEQRNIIVEDIELLTRELINDINQTFRDHSFTCQNLAEVIRAIQILVPAMSADCENVKKSLKELVESDKLVEENISRFCGDLKVEINKIRKDSKSIRGYRQLESLGSCFIDKIK